MCPMRELVSVDFPAPGAPVMPRVAGAPGPREHQATHLAGRGAAALDDGEQPSERPPITFSGRGHE